MKRAMSVFSRPKRCWSVLFAIVGVFASGSLWAQDHDIVAPTPEQKLAAAIEVLQQLDAGAVEVEVIVNLVAPAGKPGDGEWDSRPKLRGWQRALKARRDEVFAELAIDEFKPRHLFENQPGFSGRVTRQGLEKLARHPRVASIQISRPVEPQLKQGLPLMNALLTRSNYGGAGVSVAIVDSGVDYRHPYLGGTSVFPNTKVIGGYDFGDSDSNPLPRGNAAHGTACAGIAAGNVNTNLTGDYIGGVAPQAKLYALKITSGTTESASDADIIAAWNWCITHKNDDANNPILVISTSFGGGR
jgi:subtilisin family serine protease